MAVTHFLCFDNKKVLVQLWFKGVRPQTRKLAGVQVHNFFGRGLKEFEMTASEG